MKVYFSKAELEVSAGLHIEIMKHIDPDWQNNKTLKDLEQRDVLEVFRGKPTHGVTVSDTGVEVELPEDLYVKIAQLYTRKVKIVAGVVKTVMAALQMFSTIMEEFQSEVQELAKDQRFFKSICREARSVKTEGWVTDPTLESLDLESVKRYLVEKIQTEMDVSPERSDCVDFVMKVTHLLPFQTDSFPVRAILIGSNGDVFLGRSENPLPSIKFDVLEFKASQT